MFSGGHSPARRICRLLFLAAVAALPVLLGASEASAGQATLIWNANTEPDLAGYKLYYGTASRTYPFSVNVGNQISYVLSGLLNGQIYFFAVTAYDLGGNESGLSAEVSMTVQDTTPPVISAVAIPVRTSSGASISWTTNEASDSQVEYGPTTAYGSSTAVNASLVTSHLVTLGGLAETSLYHFRVRSRDAAGNLATSADFTFTTLDGTPPTVSITTPAAGATVAGTVTIAASATDNVGIAGVQFKLNGANLGAEATLAPYAVAWNTTTVANGAHTLTAAARDAAGNLATSAGVSVTVLNSDTTLPTVSVTAPISGATVSGTVSVAASASDNVGVAGVQFKLDGANLGAEVTTAPYTVAWNTTTAANGARTLTATARDAAGNSRTSGAITVTASNTTPPPLISSVASSNISSAAATITWTTDTASDTQVEYGPTSAYGSATALATTLVTAHSQMLGGLIPGLVYHYRVKSRNAAGNLATSGDFTFTTLPAATTGLVGAWAFDDGSGTTARDTSGNGNTGTLLNGPTWTAGKIGQALSFNGVNQYVSVPHASGFDAYPLTLAMWMKTSTTAGVRGLVNKYVPGSSNGYEVFVSNGNLCAWYFRDSSNSVSDGSGCPFNIPGYNDNQWHHVAFVVDALGGRLYVDGVQRAAGGWTGTGGAPSTTQDVHIGVGGAEYFQGVLDDVRIYNRALSATEVLGLSDTVAPAISTVTVSSITSSSATVSWTTNEAADSQVEYGTTTAYGSTTPLSTGLVTSRSQMLSGLAASALYHYRVKSRDAAGNLSVSADRTFTTLAGSAATPNSSSHRKKKRDWTGDVTRFLRDLF
jgi:hypothetical protein